MFTVSSLNERLPSVVMRRGWPRRSAVVSLGLSPGEQWAPSASHCRHLCLCPGNNKQSIITCARALLKRLAV